MATPQHPIGSGFGARSTAADVVQGIDLSGRLALVTGGAQGIGAMAPGARVMALSSRGRRRSDIRWDDLHWQRQPYDKWRAYGQSKTANVLFAVRLDALGRDAGVRAFAVHPGGIRTELLRHVPLEEQIATGLMKEDGSSQDWFKTPEQGAATTLWAATSPGLEGMGGVYCEDCGIAEPAVPHRREGGVEGYAVDPDAAARLWALSAELTGVDAFAGVRA